MNKYRNIKTVVDGITFASKAEARTYQQLEILQRNGNIKNLVLQPKWPLKVNGMKIGSYVADFSYIPKGSLELVVVDVKGVRTAVYKMKKKMMKAIHGIDITEVK